MDKYHPNKNDPFTSDLKDEAKEKEEEMEEEKQELSVIATKELPQLPPKVVIKYASEAAKSLTEIVSKKEKKVIINGKHYLEFADWQTLGKFFKMGVKTYEAMPITIEGVTGAKARADVVNLETGLVIGGAEAYCLKDEPNWKDKPFFQLASMAQTRAAAKALRNELGWVAVLGGFADTPAEEMVNGTIKETKPQSKPQGDLSEVLQFGKYKGKSLIEINEINSSYLPWLLDKSDMFKDGKNAELRDKIELFLDAQRFENENPEEVY